MQKLAGHADHGIDASPLVAPLCATQACNTEVLIFAIAATSSLPASPSCVDLSPVLSRFFLPSPTANNLIASQVARNRMDSAPVQTCPAFSPQPVLGAGEWAPDGGVRAG